MKKTAKIVRIKCCAFCGLTQYQVDLLIQGPAIGFESHVCICGECVKVCATILAADEHAREAEPTPDLEPEATS